MGGRRDPAFVDVREALLDNFWQRGEHGAAVAVYLDGVGVDLHGRYADAAATSLWQRDTLVTVFSAGNGVLTAALLRLAREGGIGLDAPVARVWPAFAAAGREAVTPWQILFHRAGLPAVARPQPDATRCLWQRMGSALVGAALWWPPGAGRGYHVDTFGFLVGELMRRSCRLSPGAWLREAIAGPLGADLHLGRSRRDLPRVAEFLWPPSWAAAVSVRGAGWRARMRRNAYFNPAGLSGHGAVKRTTWHWAQIPSANAQCERECSERARNRSLAAPEMRAEAVREASRGPDLQLERETGFGLGFPLPLPGWNFGPGAASFGPAGAGGAVGFGYVMNRMGPR